MIIGQDYDCGWSAVHGIAMHRFSLLLVVGHYWVQEFACELYCESDGIDIFALTAASQRQILICFGPANIQTRGTRRQDVDDGVEAWASNPFLQGRGSTFSSGPHGCIGCLLKCDATTPV